MSHRTRTAVAALSAAFMLSIGCSMAAGPGGVTPPPLSEEAAPPVSGFAAIKHHRRGVAAPVTLVEVASLNRAELDRMVERGIDVLAARPEGVLVEVNPAQMHYLQSRPGVRVTPVYREGVTVDNAFDPAYRTFDEMTAALRALAGRFPALATLESIGKSVEGRDLWMLRLTSGGGNGAAKPAVIYMGLHHAREIVTPEICLNLATLLLEGYGRDATLTRYLDTREIHIIPMLNPDGHMLVAKGADWRKNTQNPNHEPLGEGPEGPGVDLNRNYGYQWGSPGSSSDPHGATYRGRGPFSEPETKALRDYVVAHPNIKLSMSYHSFSDLILYPWAYTRTPSPDEKVMGALARKLASFNGYRPQHSSDLYLSPGNSNDWLYGERKILAYTTEVGGYDDYFDPPYSRVGPLWNENKPGALYLLEIADDPKKVLG